MEIIVLPNQSLQDIAILHTGSVLNTFEIAFVNGLAVSDALVNGQTLIIPDVKIDNAVLRVFKMQNLKPATSYKITDSLERRGIGWFKVGQNFKID